MLAAESKKRWFLAIPLAAPVALACASSSPGSPPMAGKDGGALAVEPAPAGDGAPAAKPDAGAPLDGRCADTFGVGLSEGFGRVDGVVYAVQRPGDESCAMPNRDHLVLQVLMKGDVYRLVVNVQSDRGEDTKIRMATIAHALPSPSFDEGWHTGVALDYAGVLGTHSTDDAFASYSLDEAVTKISADLRIGDPIAVYATTGSGRPESAHLVHRNTSQTNADGAIVVAPSTATPQFLLFHFADQKF